HVLAGWCEHLDAPIGSIRDIDKVIVRDLHGVDRIAEVLVAISLGVEDRRRLRAASTAAAARRRAAVPTATAEPTRRRIAVRCVAEGAPHPLELAGGRIEDNDAPVAVAVGDVRFIGLRIDEDVGRTVDVTGVRVALALAGFAELAQELSLKREVQQHVIANAAATDPDD